jgi:16S rRNA (guanine527-N7)-methyltransferase
MAIAKPDAHFTLVEPMERRANWLKAVIQDLEIPNIEVIRARAEEVTKQNFDFATARAVASFDKLLKLMTPLISDSTKGTVIALKGSKAQQEIEEAGKILAKFGYSDPEVLILGSGKAPETATVVRTFLK